MKTNKGGCNLQGIALLHMIEREIWGNKCLSVESKFKILTLNPGSLSSSLSFVYVCEWEGVFLIHRTYSLLGLTSGITS